MDVVGPPSPLRAGSRLLGAVVVERVLQADEWGFVYAGRDARRGSEQVVAREYAPKALAVRNEDGSVGPASAEVAERFASGLECFVRDGHALASVNHPAIPAVRQVGEADGTACVVVERVEGRSLEEEIADAGPMPEEAVRRMVDSLAEGLAQAHARGLLHLDVHPGNVILRAGSRFPALVGFGAVRLPDDPAASGAARTMPAPGYAPIERYSALGRMGPWTDVYSLGAVAYAALVGRAPEDAPDRVRCDSMKSADAAAAHPVSPEFAQALEAAMRVDENDRPQDLDSWRRVLAAGPRPRMPVADRAGRRGSRSGAAVRRRLFFAAGAAAIVAAVVAVVSVSRNRTLTPEELAATAESQMDLAEETIELVEAALWAEGHLAGEPDGQLDSELRAGLREWQAAAGIEATGYLDRESLAELLPAGREAQEEAEEARLEAERRAREEEARLAAAERRAEERRAAEARRREADRQAAERRAEQERLEAERLAEEQRLAEEARLAEEERLAQLEAERRAEQERLAEEARLAEEERLEAERLAEEERLAQLEAESRAAEARRAAEAEREAELVAEARRLAAAQRQALAALPGDDGTIITAGSALAGPSGQLNWRQEVNRVRWDGVRINRGRVTDIELQGRSLAGVIPPALGSLRELRILNLRDNRLTGRIPAELGGLRTLEALYLDGNRLTGEIPASLGSLSRLEDLYLSGNDLSGALPPELGRLPNLKRLRLSGTRVAGSIPSELGLLSSLEELRLEDNQLSGSIPASLQNLPRLRVLELGNNRLSGCIPTGLERFWSDINPQLDGVYLPRCTGVDQPQVGRQK